MRLPVSGKTIAVGLLILGLAAATANVWYRYLATRRTQQLWGPDAMDLIAGAPEISLIAIPARASKRNSNMRDVKLRASEGILDVSTAPGMTHLRHWLRQDASYDWDAPVPLVENPPQSMGLSNNDITVGVYILTFREEDRFVNFLIDSRCQYMRQGIGGPGVTFSEKMSNGIRTFIQESFEANWQRLRDERSDVTYGRSHD
jgi:hypothetical protein